MARLYITLFQKNTIQKGESLRIKYDIIMLFLPEWGSLDILGACGSPFRKGALPPKGMRAAPDPGSNPGSGIFTFSPR